MKFLFVLAFLAAVSAVPRPQHIPTNNEGLQLWAPPEGSGDGDIQSENGSSPSPPNPTENPAESDDDESDEDEDDSDEKINIVDLINSLGEALKKKIRERLSHKKAEDSDEDDIYVPRVPEDQDGSNDTATDDPLPGNNTEGPNSVPPPNNTVAENDTVSNNRPNINITAIRKEIHDKIENILSNILGPLLRNNSVEEESESENVTAINPPEPVNSERPPNDVASNETLPGAPEENEGSSNDSAIAPPQSGNNTVPSLEAEANSGNETEIIVIDPAVVGTEPSSGSEISRGIRPNVGSATQSQVRFVNTA